MRIQYLCDICKKPMAELELPELDEEKLGFDALTPEERADIIRFDLPSGVVTVKSLCDHCVEGAHIDALPENARLVH